MGASLSDFDGVTAVVADTLRFKMKLGIGEDAYASIRHGRSVQELLGLGGAAAIGSGVASSSAVATTFFGGGWLSALGLTSAVTPVGWVVAAGVATAGAYFGVTRLLRGYHSSRVRQVPEFINTPIDLLGATLLDLIGTLAVKLARIDGSFDRAERSAITRYFVSEWGYEPTYVEKALAVIETGSDQQSLEQAADVLAEFKRSNPDCNYAAMTAEMMGFLRDIAETDGVIDEREETALAKIESILSDASWLSGERIWNAVSATPKGLSKWFGGLSGTSKDKGAQAVPVGADNVEEFFRRNIPIVWLLGKTGAGKSSLIQALTGLRSAEIGNGFQPCTKASQRFDFPQDRPLLRFLDTRGLGEVGYDPAEDLAVCEGHSHAVLILSRLDDPVQAEIANALALVLKRRPELEVILVHSGADLIAGDPARERARAANAAVFARATGQTVREVTVSLPPEGNAQPSGIGALIDQLADILPAAALLLARSDARTAEQKCFEQVRNRVLIYAGAAGASDVVPLAGVAVVPATQMAMLADIARAYDLVWTRAMVGAFLAALGLGAAARFGASFGLRELGKLVPVYGQTVGAAAAGAVSFAATFALGRAAAMFLHHQAVGEPLPPDVLRSAYAEALRRSSRARD